MKRIIRLLSFLMLGMICMPALAQQIPQLPVDKDVRIGKLPNGLTYYIRHNEYPKGQADFYIAQKVGSILEEDNQRGLAHFLEHMCFNGTTNFPGKNLINWLESVGVKFGQNLNAYTDIDETVYNISNVPVAREGVQDSCLLILHDWANDLLLEPEEIDSERGVIHQEWRRSMVGQMRILEQLLPVIYPGSRYGYRLPIGIMDVVDNFPYQALRDYYEMWYRPDQQGVVVVGDIDVDLIENKIKNMFSSIEMPANAPERIYFEVDDTPGTIYAIGKDKEQSNYLASLMIKSDAFPDSLKNTAAYYAQNYVQDMIASMLNTRLNDITSKPDAPFAAASVDFGKFFVAKTKDMFDISVVGKNADLPEAMAAAYREVLRAQRGGFTASEYNRARSEYLSRWERSYNNRNQRENVQFVNQYVRHFIDSNPIPGIETEYPMVQMIANSVPVQAINETIKQLVTPDNRVLLALLPEKEGTVYPTEEQFAQALTSVDAEEIEAFVDETKSEPLIPQLPAPGKIVKESTNDQWGATEWTLSNGAKVFVKKTNFKDDEILFYAGATGNGTAQFSDADANSIIFMPVALSAKGLGDYTNADLDKYLAGKQASVSPSFGSYTRDLQGFTTPKDLPTLMELIYMNFTAINFSADEFEALQNTYAGVLHNQESNPQYQFQKNLYKVLFQAPAAQSLSVDAVKGASRERIIEMARTMTANAADYTFVFVGNVDLETLRPLVEQYIASLPSDPAAKVSTVSKFNPGLSMKPGKGIDTFTTPMETPQTWVFIATEATAPYTVKNQQLAYVAGQILSKRLIDIVREKEQAVYSISASGSMNRIADYPILIQTAFPMKPELKDKVLGIIEEQFGAVATEVTPEELAKVKEFMVKNYTEGKEKNAQWLGAIGGWARNGVDTFNPDIETINAITPADVQAFMKDILSQGNYRVVILDPEAAE